MCVYVCVCMHARACMYVCMCVRMHVGVCMYVCMYVCVCASPHVSGRGHDRNLKVDNVCIFTMTPTQAFTCLDYNSCCKVIFFQNWNGFTLNLKKKTQKKIPPLETGARNARTTGEVQLRGVRGQPVPGVPEGRHRPKCTCESRCLGLIFGNFLWLPFSDRSVLIKPKLEWNV